MSTSSDRETSIPLYTAEPPFPCRWLTTIASPLVPVQAICCVSPQHGIARVSPWVPLCPTPHRSYFSMVRLQLSDR